ncbi:hypothetical protein FNV43_RR13045 [Rhamnella rubrinervis]|uniref:Uncharacterized protein n=1 Tax=Rhamnella rubrinervis TaxID=2594499 RepID=A0A8K0MES0_9ROSA|nr:hypothetical protein FNV43_RR13045 [Rhamnella rubrinervis]
MAMPQSAKEANHISGSNAADATNHLFEFLVNTRNHGFPQSSRIIRVVEQFKRFQPPTFEGTSNPLVAEDWVRGMKKTFTFMECIEA